MNIKSFYQERYKNKTPKDFESEKKCPWVMAAKDYFKKEQTANTNILDVGAGGGAILLSFPENTHKYAVELDPVNISWLEKNNVKVKSNDLSNEKIGFPTDYFDYIICTEVIEHLFDPEYALKEMLRVLKPRGKLIVTTHNSFNIFMRLKFLLGIIPSPSFDVTDQYKGEHIRLFNYHVLHKLLQRCGFVNIVNKNFGYFFHRLYYPPIFKNLLGIHHLFIVEKSRLHRLGIKT